MTNRPLVVVPLDGTDHDVSTLDLAAATAARTGAAITVTVPRTAEVLARLQQYAAGEDLSVADAAEQYAEQAAGGLIDRGADAVGVSWPSTDAPREIASYAIRHGANLVLLVGHDGRRGRRRGTAARLAAHSAVPVLVVPPEALEREEEPATIVVETLEDARILARSA